MTEQTCGKCGATVSAVHIDQERQRVTCPECQATSHPRIIREGKSYNLSKPDGVEVTRDAASLRFACHGYKSYVPTGYLIVSLVVLSILWVRPDSLETLAVMLLLGAPVIMFIGLPVANIIYDILASLANNAALLRIDHAQLTLKYGPLPYPGFSLDTRQIQQLYCRRNKHLSKRRREGELRVYYSYDLVIKTKDGRKHLLFAGFNFPDALWYFEQEIEAFLGLEDQLDAEEYPRPPDHVPPLSTARGTGRAATIRALILFAILVGMIALVIVPDLWDKLAGFLVSITH